VWREDLLIPIAACAEGSDGIAGGACAPAESLGQFQDGVGAMKEQLDQQCWSLGHAQAGQSVESIKLSLDAFLLGVLEGDSWSQCSGCRS